MDRIFEEIKNTEPFRRLTERLNVGQAFLPATFADGNVCATSDVSVGGMWGSSSALVTAALAEVTGRVLLVVTAGVEEADAMSEDLQAFRPGISRYFPAWESLPTVPEHPDALITGQRLAVLNELASIKSGAVPPNPLIVVTPIQGLLQAVASPKVLTENRLSIGVGEEHDPDKVCEWLVARGFGSSAWVENPGEFSRRGGILDVFPNDRSGAVRIEFFGDRVESIRPMDVETQRSSEEMRRVEFAAVLGSALRLDEQSKDSVSLLEYLRDDAVLALIEPTDVQERAKTYTASLADPVGTFSYDAVIRQASRFRKLYVETFGGADAIAFNVTLPGEFPPGLENVVRGLQELLSDVDRAVVFCNNEAEAGRLREMIPEESRALLTNVVIRIGRINRGFKLRDLRTAVVAHHEIFHRYSVRRATRKPTEARPLEAFVDLEKGDYVVHLHHGIGRYLGTQVLVGQAFLPATSADRNVCATEGTAQEFLVLEFRDRVKVFVPSTRVNLVQKYIGGFDGRPELSLVGGTAWEKKKDEVAKSVEELATEMVQLQALRNTNPGIQCPPDDRYQQEFEAEFLYQETEDQMTVLAEIKRDMESPRAMDRLVCGDVGYGKTELAMRAAFKSAVGGHQVAVLVPTTVLAQQHFNTFRERMADYPVVVEMLSRFRTKGEQARIISRVADGSVDVVIGTHRLLQSDVTFKDLGLVVVDEEQRFGVKHKEHFKRLRATVDVLTLTATPIPRTLHMSLLGIRDISALETPPQDRQAVETHVVRFDRRLVRDAILRELNRDGQVFFVHNRVHNINRVANVVSEIVPEALIGIGHGQMSEHELAERMSEFVTRKIDVLVATTIIESGIDIPNANTVFVNDADRFGLADLHQLRGRVGRYKHRAYAYFIVNENRRVSRKAAKRLKAIEDYAELGAGFRIALRDLEIRGAGNILGPQQSGHIAAVGYDLYCQLLDRAIHRLKNEPLDEKPETTIHVGLAAFLPTDFVPSEKDRLEVYRRLEKMKETGELAALREELEDRFGRLPAPVEGLFTLHDLRIRMEHAGILAVTRLKDRLVFTFRHAAQFLEAMKTVQKDLRVIDDETAHLVLDRKHHDTPALVALLRRLLGAEAPQAAAPKHRRRKERSKTG